MASYTEMLMDALLLRKPRPKGRMEIAQGPAQPQTGSVPEGLSPYTRGYGLSTPSQPSPQAASSGSGWSMPSFNPTMPQGLSPYTKGLGLSSNTAPATSAPHPSAPQSLDYQYPASMYATRDGGYMDAGIPPANKPAPGASNAGPFIPTPPQRPASMGQPMQLPGARPVEAVGDVSMPSQGMAGIQGFNPYATGAGPNAQAYADQFAKGDLSKLGARTYYDENGNAWNDYYVR